MEKFRALDDGLIPKAGDVERYMAIATYFACLAVGFCDERVTAS